MGSSTGNAVKKSPTTSKNDKMKEKRWNILGKKKKQRKKNDDTTRGIKQESTGERRKIKKISRKGKTIQTKQDILKQRKNSTSNQMRGKQNNFGAKYGNQENITKKPNG